MVPKKKAREILEKLQGSLRSSVQGNPKIIKDLEYRSICSKRASRTNQCGGFHQDAAGLHPGAGKSRNGKTSRQNLGRAVYKEDIGALEPSHDHNRETRDSAVYESLYEKSGHCSAPAEHGHRAYRNLTPSYHNLIQDRNFHSRSGHTLDPNRYFLSYGYKVEESHTSATCRFQVNGHNKLSMRMDIKGGKTCNKEWSNGGTTD